MDKMIELTTPELICVAIGGIVLFIVLMFSINERAKPWGTRGRV
jgi:hypothetical protein